MPVERICLIGDSVVLGRIDSENGGWAGHLWRWFIPPDPGERAVFNLGIGGQTSTDVKRRLFSECRERQPDLIILGVGVNDTHRKESDDDQSIISIQDYSHNLHEIITMARELSAQIGLVSMYPVDDQRCNPIWPNWYYKRAWQEPYVDALVRASSSADFLADIWSAWNLMPDSGKSLLVDGLHPNVKGHQSIWSIIKPKLDLLTSSNS